MHLHQVVLDRGSADDDADSHGNEAQLLHKLHLGILHLVTLQQCGGCAVSGRSSGSAAVLCQYSCRSEQPMLTFK